MVPLRYRIDRLGPNFPATSDVCALGRASATPALDLILSVPKPAAFRHTGQRPPQVELRKHGS